MFDIVIWNAKDIIGLVLLGICGLALVIGYLIDRWRK